MTWRQPELLALLVLVAAVALALVAAARQRGAALRAFADEALTARLARGVSARQRAIRLGLRVVAMALLVVALAGPKWGFHWEEVRREGIDLIVALDTSRSMLATDVVPNRLERAKLAVLDLLPRLRGDRIGLVAYAGTAFLEAPLTLDYAAFARSLRALQVGIIPRGGTSLSRAIEASLDGFEARQGKYEALILISDGENHEGDAIEAAKRAAESGVKIYTVGIGTPEGELLPLPADGGAAGYVKDRRGQVVKSRLNEQLLKDVALETGGAYVRGLGPQLGLDEVFDQHIARMERREVDSGLQRRYEERFQLPLLIAVVLLFAEAALGDRRRRRATLLRNGAWRSWLSRLAGAGRRRSAAAVVAAALSLAPAGAEAELFGGERDPVNQGVELFEQGEYEEALTRFGDALVESPASPLLQFDLAAALYKQGRYDEAIASLEKVAGEGGAEWSARANYNLGNAHFRAGQASEETEPQQALERWGQSLLAYRRALAADPTMEDARFNHELVRHRIEELRRRLEEQQQEQQEQEEQEPEQQGQENQEQQNQQEQTEQDPQEQEGHEEQQQETQEDQNQQQQQDQAQAEQEQQGEQPQPDPAASEEQQPDAQESSADQQDAAQEPESQDQAPQPDEPEAGQEAAEDRAEEQQAGAGGAASEEQAAAEQAREQAARAVLDLAREEELGPQEVGRQIEAAGVGEPAADW